MHRMHQVSLLGRLVVWSFGRLNKIIATLLLLEGGPILCPSTAMCAARNEIFTLVVVAAADAAAATPSDTRHTALFDRYVFSHIYLR